MEIEESIRSRELIGFAGWLGNFVLIALPITGIFFLFDLPQRIDRGQLLERFNGLPVLSLSTLDGLGCPELVRTVADRCRQNVDDGGEAICPDLRHREALRLAAGALEIAAELLSRPAVPLDQAVVELRGAVASLGEITGESVGEEILDRIFSRFCLGK